MKTNTIILIVVTLAVAALAYWYFFTGTGNEPPLTTVPNASDAEVTFQGMTNRLPTDFSTAIFSDPRFAALVDITQPIQIEPLGRLDPLAPIPGVGL